MQKLEKKNIVLYIVLTICTFGIFYFYWAYTISRDSTYAENENESILVPVLLMFLLPFLGVYYCEKKLVTVCEKIGMKHEEQSILLLILGFFGYPFIGFIILQDTLNKIIDFEKNISVEYEEKQDQQKIVSPSKDIETEIKDEKLDEFSKKLDELTESRKTITDENQKNDNSDEIIKLFDENRELTVKFLNERCSKEQFATVKEIYEKINLDENEELKNALENLMKKYSNE